MTRAYIYVDLTRLPAPYSIGCYICRRLVGSDYHDEHLALKALRQHITIVHSTGIPIASPNPFRPIHRLQTPTKKPYNGCCGGTTSPDCSGKPEP